MFGHTFSVANFIICPNQFQTVPFGPASLIQVIFGEDQGLNFPVKEVIS
jgi:hypothetical protein